MCVEKHTLTQEEKDELERRREEAKNQLEEARKNFSQNPREYEQAKYNLDHIEAKLNAGMTYEKFVLFLKRECKSLGAQMTCLSMEEYAYWIQAADKDWLADTCRKMNGRRDVKIKYDSLHSALKSWWERDYKNPANI